MKASKRYWLWMKKAFEKSVTLSAGYERLDLLETETESS